MRSLRHVACCAQSQTTHSISKHSPRHRRYITIMYKLAILSSSVRKDRNSHRVALYFEKFLKDNFDVDVDLIDLKAYDFPVFEERLKYTENPTPEQLEFAKRIEAAEGVIIVTPEYNGGYPASLKNAIDFLYKEWTGKPVALAPVSDGRFAGTQVIISLQWTLWKMRMWTVPHVFHTMHVHESYAPDGTPSDREGTDKRAKPFVDKLLWCVEANRRMEA